MKFDDDHDAVIDPEDPNAGWIAALLTELYQNQLPAYVELSPSTNVIVDVHVPLIARVSHVEVMASGDADVRLLTSAARHRLHRTQPDFNELLAALVQARDSQTTVAITEAPEDHAIVDVRTVSHPFELPPDLSVPPPGALPPPPVSIVSSRVADTLFELAIGRTCDPTHATASCIPFLYPDDGCWARAHRMCQMFAERGIEPGKVWLYGDLHAHTMNQPHCRVDWIFHVAPIVQIGTGDFWDAHVIDPSLFDGPVPVRQWIGVQGDPDAVPAVTPWSVFDRISLTGRRQSDPDFSKTDRELRQFRAKLIHRAQRVGPPPYASCSLETAVDEVIAPRTTA